MYTKEIWFLTFDIKLRLIHAQLQGQEVWNASRSTKF